MSYRAEKILKEMIGKSGEDMVAYFLSHAKVSCD
jgi:hypothetical protein